MKFLIEKFGVLLTVAIAVIAFPQAWASSTLPAKETVLHSLTAATDGGTPRTSLILASDGNFYGSTFTGGATGGGTLYRYTPSGDFTVLYTFPQTAAYAPSSNLIEAADGNLYGMLYSGGTAQTQGGGIYKYDMSSGTVTILHNFQTGGYGTGDPIDDGKGTIYGTAAADGAFGSGSLWSYNYQTNTFTTLYSFTADGMTGYLPSSGLVLASDGYLYGSTGGGGANSAGCLFVLNTDGTGYTDFYDFTFGNDGGEPIGGLTEASDGNLYGWSQAGNQYDNFGGTFYRIVPKGAASTFELVYGFQDSDGYEPKFGRMPIGGDGNLYLAGRFGGAYGNGQMMRFDLSGNKTTVYDFGATSTDASHPYSQPIVGPDGNLYGTTNTGGDNGSGTLYELTTGLPPVMTLTPSLTSVTPDTSITLTWSVNNAFSLNAQICVARSNDNSWSGIVATRGTATVTPTNTNTTYALTCGGNESITTSVAVTGVALAIKNTSLPTSYQNTAYSAQLSATGGKEPYTWSVNGGSANLPAGITLNASTGLLSGTPMQTGTFSFVVQVTDSQGGTASVMLTVVVRLPPPVISTTQLPGAAVGRPYSATLVATGTVAPYVWSISGGSLPTGLSLSSVGVISGTPTTYVNGLFTVQVTDSQAQPESNTTSLSITVALPTYPAVTASVTPAAVNPGQSVTLNAGVYGSTLNRVPAPTGTVQFKVNGADLGAPLTLGSSSTVSLTTQSFSSAGTYQIAAVYSGDSLYVPLTSPVTNLVVAPPTLTVAPTPLVVGQQGTVTGTLTMQYFAGSDFTFTCANLPTNTTCSFGSPSADGTATLTITTGVAPNASVKTMKAASLFGLPAFLGLTILCFGKRRRLLRVLCVLVLIAPIATWVTACGGSSSPKTPAVPSTPAGTTTIGVTATAGSQSATSSVQLTVN